MSAIDVIRRIRWKNIMGLMVFAAIAVLLVAMFAFFNVLVHGDCVEKSGTKACFSVEKSTIEPTGWTRITVDATNTGKSLSDAYIAMRVSPNLANMSATSQDIPQMAPGDTIKREFRVAARGELGRFKVEFDINNDGLADKELFISVKKAG